MSKSNAGNSVTRQGAAVRVRRALFVAIISVALVGCGATTTSSGGGGGGAQKSPAPSTSSTKPFFVTANDPWGSSWSYNIFSPNFVSAAADDIAILQLALQNTHGLASFTPQLATSWTLKNGTLTVNLRHGARWQDGKAITSQAVLDSVELQGLTAGEEWQDISSVSAPSPYKVVYKLAPGAPTATSEVNILTMMVLPPQLWKQFLTRPGLLRTIETYYQADRANPTTAPNTAAGKVISGLDGQIVKYKPTTFIADGPFKFDKVTIAEAKLSKNPDFYNAKKVKVQSLIWQETPTAAAGEGEELTGEIDYTWDGYIGNTWKAILRVPNMHIIARPNYADYAIYFNSRRYPLNMVQVRQALAYILHTPKLLEANDGVPNYDNYVKYPSLMYNAIVNKYLTPQQLHSLNPYRYNPAKATSLLESVGFHKRSGQWYMPNGKRFSLTMDAPAGWAGVETTPKYVAGVLENFGIKTSGSAVEQPGYWSQMQQGDFDLDWGWGGWSDNPLQRLDDVIGPPLNYTTTGTYKGDPGIGFGPTMTVPGLGKVNVPNAIQQQTTSLSYGPRMKQLVWDWAKLVNKELPVLSFGDKNLPIQYSTARYTWPPASSHVWDLMGLNLDGGLGVMFQSGMIRPK